MGTQGVELVLQGNAYGAWKVLKIQGRGLAERVHIEGRVWEVIL
jgi:hypothetical protein